MSFLVEEPQGRNQQGNLLCHYCRVAERTHRIVYGGDDRCSDTDSRTAYAMGTVLTRRVELRTISARVDYTLRGSRFLHTRPGRSKLRERNATRRQQNDYRTF